MDVDRGARVSAYASAREFGHGVVIGPVVASGALAGTLRPDAARTLGLAAGIHVLAEKPLAISLADLEAARTAVERAGISSARCM